MNPDGGGMHEAANARGFRRLEQLTSPFHVDLAVIGIGMAGGPIDGGHVHHWEELTAFNTTTTNFLLED